jgi:hypothetical protein
VNVRNITHLNQSQLHELYLTSGRTRFSLVMFFPTANNNRTTFPSTLTKLSLHSVTVDSRSLQQAIFATLPHLRTLHLLEAEFVDEEACAQVLAANIVSLRCLHLCGSVLSNRFLESFARALPQQQLRQLPDPVKLDVVGCKLDAKSLSLVAACKRLRLEHDKGELPMVYRLKD